MLNFAVDSTDRRSTSYCIVFVRLESLALLILKLVGDLVYPLSLGLGGWVILCFCLKLNLGLNVDHIMNEKGYTLGIPQNNNYYQSF